MGKREIAELAMLADGSLPPDRRAEVEARIAAAPGGSALLENERLAVDALRGAATVRAPASLRERIAAEQARACRAPRRRRAQLGGALVGAVAVLALALVLILPGGAPGAPSVSQAASLASRGATSPAPPAQATRRSTLARDVDEVYFPNWAGIGFTASGERVDRLDGRLLDTIYYTARGGAQLAYTIVGGSALAQPGGAALSRLNHIELRSIALGDRVVVTWRRGGHTCILSGAHVSDSVLLHLAAGKPSV